MRRIKFLSAADRLNYGDLLFPLIFQSQLDDELRNQFDNYGLVTSDFSDFGALPTRSYRHLLHDLAAESSDLVIGGGDVLFPDWTTLYSFINPIYAKLMRSHKARSLEQRLRLASRMLCHDQRIQYPFSPAKECLPKGTRTLFNGVGGFLEQGQIGAQQAELLRSADYLSVRNQRLHQRLDGQGIPSSLVPDTAILMSESFPVDALFDLVSSQAKGGNTPYIVIQLGATKGPNDLTLLARDLQRISNKLQVRVIALPIGLAPNHSDQRILQELASMKSEISYIHPQSLFDQMYVIANSSAFIGTSLHGMITAQSFNTPFFPINPRIHKLENYRESWANDLMPITLDFNQISLIPELIENWNYTLHTTLTLEQKWQAKINLKEQIKFLRNGLSR